MGRLHSGHEGGRTEVPPAVARGLHAARRGIGSPPSRGRRHAGGHGRLRVAPRPAGHASRRHARVQRPRAPDDRGRHGRGQVAGVPDTVRPLELHERHARRPLHRHAQPPEPAALLRPSACRAGARRGRAEAARRRPEGPHQLPLPADARRADAGRMVDALGGGAGGFQGTIRVAAHDARRRSGRPRARASPSAALLPGRGLRRARLPLPREVLHREGSRPRAARARGGGEPRARPRRSHLRRIHAPARIRAASLRRGAQP